MGIFMGYVSLPEGMTTRQMVNIQLGRIQNIQMFLAIRPWPYLSARDLSEDSWL